jgi:hypothetical protein
MGDGLANPNSQYQPRDIKGIEDVARDHAAVPNTSHGMFTGEHPVPEGLHSKQVSHPEPDSRHIPTGTGVGRSFASRVNQHLGETLESRQVWKQVADEVRGDPERYLPGLDEHTRADIADRIESGRHWEPRHVEAANKAVPHAFHTSDFDEHPVGSGQRHDNGATTHEDRRGFFDKIKNAFTPPEPIDLGDGFTFNTHRDGGFHKLDDHDVFISSHLIDGRDPADAARVYAQVKQYMTTGLTLYRGISAWHPTWKHVEAGEIPSLGTRPHPDFSTWDTKYVPFSADRNVALGASLAHTGMHGGADDRRFVHGYDPSVPTQPVGMVLSKRVQLGDGHGIAFINSTETQLSGPIHDFGGTTLHMGTAVSDVFGGPNDGRTLADSMPPRPDQQEIDDYVAEHGSLRHDPNGPGWQRPAPKWLSNAMNVVTGQHTPPPLVEAHPHGGVTLHIPGHDLPAHDVGIFYKLDQHDAYINKALFQPNADPADRADIFGQVDRYLTTGLRLQRGIASWHPTWHAVDEGVIPPLGMGDHPNFDTRETRFVPFTTSRHISAGAAISRTGMDRSDDIRFTPGYDPADGHYQVGSILHKTVSAENGDAVAFILPGETQVGGPIRNYGAEPLTMDTPLSHVYGEPSMTGRLGDIMPAKASQQDIDAYVAQHGSLRNDPNPVTSRPAPVFNRDGYVGETEAGPSNHRNGLGLDEHGTHTPAPRQEQHGAPLQRPQRPQRQPFMDAIPEDREPEAVNHDQVPGYVRDNESLGLGRLLDGDRLADRIIQGVTEQLPHTAEERATARGLHEIHHVVTQDFGSLMGDGRKFEVRVGDKVYEVTVKARLDFTDAQHVHEDNRVLERSGGIDRSTSESTTKTKQHDLATAISAGNGIGGGSVFASILHAKPTVTLESGHGASHSVSIGHEGSDVVEAKAGLEITVTDKHGVNPNPAGNVTFDHEATIAIPHDAVGTPSHDTTPRPVNLSGLGVFGAESVHGVGEAFDKVAKDLHPKITEIGSPGRKVLQQFVSAGNVRDNLPAMAHDWVYSPDLISADGSRIGAVRMRIEPTDAALESGAEGYKIGSTLGGSGGPGRSNTSTTGGELWLGGSAAGVADPTHSVAAGASLTAAFSKTDSVGTKIGDTAKWQSVLETEGVTGLYKLGFRLHMQVIGHDPVTVHDASAHVRMSGIEAHNAGLVVPNGAHGAFEPTPQPRHAPSYLASGKSVGLGNVFHLSGGDDVRQRVEETLRGNENLKDLAPDFGSDKLKGSSRGDTALAAANRRELDTKLSDENLKANMNSMLGDGMKIRLKKPGLFLNRYVTVTVKARLTGMQHLGQAPDHAVSGSGATSTKLGITGAAKKGVTVYADGRVTTPFTTHQVKGSPTASIGAQYGYQRTHSTEAGPSTGHKLSTSGSENVHGFKANVHYEVTVDDHSRMRSWVRRLTPGTPGTHVPETHNNPHVAPPGGFSRPARGEVTVLVPESLTTTTAPHQHVDNHVTTRMDTPPSINALRAQARGTRQPEFQRVEAIVGAEHIQRAATEALTEAGGGDRSLSLSGTVSADALHHAFSPENLTSDPQVVKHGVQVDGLQHNRRIADRVGAVGMRMELSDPKLVSISDEIALKHQQTGGYNASGGKQTQHSFGLNMGTSSSRNAVSLTPNVEHAHGRAGVFATASLRNWTWTSKLTKSLGGTAEHSVSSPPGRTVLLQMNARVHVVAESRQTNMLHDTDVRTAGRTVELPDSVFVRVTEQEAREMGVLPDHNLGGETPIGPKPGLPAPSTLNTDRPSIGFGHVEPTGDLVDLVPSLRHNLGELGEHLLPQSVLDDAMGNMRRLDEQSSQDGIRSLVDSALNGGVSLMTPKPNVFTHDTYEVVLHARPTGDGPTFLGVTNDGSKLAHNSTGATSEAVTKGKEVSSGIGGRFAGTGLPHVADPAASMTVNNATSASLSHSTGHSITRTDSTDIAQTSSSGGAQARYKLPVTFQLEIRHKGETIAVSDSDRHDLVVRKLADDVSTATNVPVGHDAMVTHFEARPDEHEQWQHDGERLPDEVHVDDFTGDVDQLRREARGLAGDLSTSSDHALTTSLTPEVIKANLPAMLKGPVDLPGLRDAGLSAYAKLTNPRLASVSDSVDLGGGRTDSSTVDTSVTRSVSGSVNAIIGGLGGNVTDPPHGQQHRDYNVGGAGVYFDRGGMEHSQSFGSSGPVHPATGGSTSTTGRSKVVLHDTEIRLVKGDRGVTLKFDDSARVRMYDDGTLPRSVAEAQDKVRDAEKAWHDAEQEVVRAQHAADDAYLAAKPQIDRLRDERRDELAQNRQDQIDHNNHVNQLRRQLWDAYAGGHQDRIVDLERQLSEAHEHGRRLTIDRGRLMGPIREADRPRREARANAVDAYRRARDAEDAWWAARRERDSALAGQNPPPRDEPAPHEHLPELDLGPDFGDHFQEHTTASLGEDLDHHRQLLDQNTRDSAVHMANAGAARERGMQALRDGDLAGFRQHHQLLDRMHVEGEHLVRQWQEITAAPEAHTASPARDEVSHADIDLVRDDAPLNFVRPETEHGRFHYEMRRMEVKPGIWVREATVKVHIEPGRATPREVGDLWKKLERGADQQFNHEKLPNGDHFKVRLERVDDRLDADIRASIGEHGTDKHDGWSLADTGEQLAHKVGTALGLTEHHVGEKLTQHHLEQLSLEPKRRAVESLAHADSHAESRRDWFTGRDAAGHERRFPMSRVTRTELRDASGKVFGTSFYNEPADRRAAEKWAKGDNPDRVYHYDADGKDRGANGHDLVTTRTGMSDKSAVLAFHANPRTASLHVRGLGNVHVEPHTLADIAVRTSGFQQAVGDGRRTTMLLACEAGARTGPGGLAHDLQKALGQKDFSDRTIAGSTIMRFGHRNGDRFTALESGGHFNVFGQPLPEHEAATVDELATALRRGHKYAGHNRVDLDGRIPLSDRAGTLAMTKSILDAVVAKLPGNGGHLDLGDVHRQAANHQRPDIVAATVLAHITADPTLAGQVHSITDDPRTHDQVSVPFGRNETRLTPGRSLKPMDDFAHRLAALAVERQANGQPLPRAHIKGYATGSMWGNTKETAEATGRQRAEEAREHLMHQVYRHLQRLTPPTMREIDVARLVPESGLLGVHEPGRANPREAVITLHDEHATAAGRPAPLNPHLLEPIPDLRTSHAAVDEDSLTARLAGHGADEETSRLVVDAAKDAVDATRSLEGEEAAGRFASAMPHAMRLLEKAGVVTTLLRRAGDAVTAGLTLSHVLDGVARAWAQGGNAAAAAAVAQDMKRLGLGFAEVRIEGTETDVR